MNRYAQEFDEAVLFAHVDLYVNDWTLSLGDTGSAALDCLHELAVQNGLVSGDSRPLDVVPESWHH